MHWYRDIPHWPWGYAAGGVLFREQEIARLCRGLTENLQKACVSGEMIIWEMVTMHLAIAPSQHCNVLVLEKGLPTISTAAEGPRGHDIFFRPPSPSSRY